MANRTKQNNQWTPEQDDFLRAHYSTASIADLFRGLAERGPARTTIRAIQQHTAKLGLVRGPSTLRENIKLTPWSSAEIDYLRDAFPRGDSTAEIAAYFIINFGVRRTDQSIRSRACLSHLRRPGVDAPRTPGLRDPAVVFRGVRFEDDPRAVNERTVGAQPVSRREVFRMSTAQACAL